MLVVCTTTIASTIDVNQTGCLDFVDSLRDSHVRQVFGILRSLSSQRQHDDELHILLRKYLSHNLPRYKKIGIIGKINLD